MIGKHNPVSKARGNQNSPGQAEITHTHTHTHTHTLVFMVYGDSLGVMVFIQTVSAIALHLNLALTGDGAFLLSPQKRTLYDL